MTPEAFSESNVLNSLSLYVASKLLASGYLLYWHKRDAVQIADSSTGWYTEWSKNGATYLANSTVAAAFSAARGLVTLTGEIPAVPRFIIRLIDDTSIGPADVVSVPTLSIEVGPAIAVSDYELGSGKKWRSRHLIVDGYVRTVEEQGRFKDFFSLWFDNNQALTIRNHDAGTLAQVGEVTVVDSVPRYQTLVMGAEATTYQVLLNARLVYVA